MPTVPSRTSLVKLPAIEETASAGSKITMAKQTSTVIRMAKIIIDLFLPRFGKNAKNNNPKTKKIINIDGAPNPGNRLNATIRKAIPIAIWIINALYQIAMFFPPPLIRYKPPHANAKALKILAMPSNINVALPFSSLTAKPPGMLPDKTIIAIAMFRPNKMPIKTRWQIIEGLSFFFSMITPPLCTMKDNKNNNYCIS